jgi:tetratricopeptide (TPR) repeat protein
LGLVLNSQRKLGEAEEAIREALTIQRKLFREEHPDVAVSLYNLARVLYHQGKLSEAEGVYRDSLAMRRKLMGNDHLQVEVALRDLAEVCWAEGKSTEAESLLRECLTICEKKIPNDFNTFLTRYLLGRVLLKQKKYADAEPLLLSGYNGMAQGEAQLPAWARGRLKDALQLLVQLYDATGPTEQAAEWKKKLAEFAAKKKAEPH